MRCYAFDVLEFGFASVFHTDPDDRFFESAVVSCYLDGSGFRKVIVDDIFHQESDGALSGLHLPASFIWNGGLLVYFRGLIPGKYLALWPVYITGDAIHELTFTVSVDDQESMNSSATSEQEEQHSIEGRRRYVTRLSRTRVYQAGFRERIIRAYGSRCALCGLPYGELLDAAHIIPDNEPSGEPIVTNGLALCRLHHAAFDRYFLGVRPDYIIEIRPDVLEDSDGPTLQHAIQALHGQSIILPKSAAQRPSKESLSVRYKRFLEVADANNVDPN